LQKDPDQHLPIRELEKLLEKARQPGSELRAPEAHPHLAVCAECREEFESLAELEAQFVRPGTTEATQPTSGCPPPQVWLEIAGGVTSPGQTLTYIEHASRCTHCGLLLHAAVG